MEDELTRNALLDAAEYWHHRVSQTVEQAKDIGARGIAGLLPWRVARWAWIRVEAERRLERCLGDFDEEFKEWFEREMGIYPTFIEIEETEKGDLH